MSRVEGKRGQVIYDPDDEDSQSSRSLSPAPSQRSNASQRSVMSRLSRFGAGVEQPEPEAEDEEQEDAEGDQDADQEGDEGEEQAEGDEGEEQAEAKAESEDEGDEGEEQAEAKAESEDEGDEDGGQEQGVVSEQKSDSDREQKVRDQNDYEEDNDEMMSQVYRTPPPTQSEIMRNRGRPEEPLPIFKRRQLLSNSGIPRRSSKSIFEGASIDKNTENMMDFKQFVENRNYDTAQELYTYMTESNKIKTLIQYIEQRNENGIRFITTIDTNLPDRAFKKYVDDKNLQGINLILSIADENYKVFTFKYYISKIPELASFIFDRMNKTTQNELFKMYMRENNINGMNFIINKLSEDEKLKAYIHYRDVENNKLVAQLIFDRMEEYTKSRTDPYGIKLL